MKAIRGIHLRALRLPSATTFVLSFLALLCGSANSGSAQSALVGFPQSVDMTVIAGEEYRIPFEVTNSGAGPVTYSYSFTLDTPPTLVNPSDGFNQTWLASTDANGPVYEWTSIALPENLLNDVSSVDDGYEAVNIDFDFPFYGTKHRQIFVGSNGYITLGSGWSEWDNSNAFPNSNYSYDLIAPFFIDLNPSAGGDIYAKVESDRVIVQYEGVFEYGGDGSSARTFQVILHRNGEIDFLYNFGDFSSGTIGIQTEEGSEGLNVEHYNSVSIPVPSAIRIFRAAPAFSDGVSTVASGRTEAGFFDFSSGSLNAEGDYTFMATIETDEPESHSFQVSLNVTQNPWIQKPSHGSYHPSGTAIHFEIDTASVVEAIDSVSLWIEGVEFEQIISDPYATNISALPDGLHSIVARIYLSNGDVLDSETIQIRVGPAGLENPTGDDDGDGMTNEEEWQWGFDPNVDDAMQDADGDRYPNIFEVKNGSNPLPVPPPSELSGIPETPAAFQILDPGGDIAEALVDALSQDYTILVLRAGAYPTFDVEQKNLLILGEDLVNPPVVEANKISVDGSTLVIDGVVIDGMAAGSPSYAMEVYESRVFLNATQVVDFDGGDYWWGNVQISGDSFVRVSNSIFRNNFGFLDSAGFFLDSHHQSSRLEVSHSTFLDCLAENSRYGMSIGSESPNNEVVVNNSIFWTRQVPVYPILNDDIGLEAVSNSVIRAGFGSGRILNSEISDQDPRLTLEGLLTADSSVAIDAASSQRPGSDIHGEGTFGPAGDLGADEFLDNENGDGSGDGLPDWWETKFFGSLEQVGGGDDEALGGESPDGLTNVLEYFYGLSPVLYDTDGDGVSDSDGIDSDGDGMTDGEERLWGFDPNFDDALGDADGDRFPNIFEVKNGSNPLSVPPPSELSGIPETPAPFRILDPGADIERMIDDPYASLPEYMILVLRAGDYAGFDVERKNVLVIGEDLTDPPVITRDWIYSWNSTLVVDGFAFDGLAVGQGRRAVYLDQSRAVLNRVTVKGYDGNGSLWGSVFVYRACSVEVANSIFNGNRNFARSGGIYVSMEADLLNELKISSCTFLNCDGNSADYGGVVGSHDPNNSILIRDSIFWQHDVPASPLLGENLEFATVENLIVKGGFSQHPSAVSEIDPLLTIDGFLMPGSPAVDSALPPDGGLDVHGESRPFGVSADIGADEFVDDDNGDGTGDGLPDWWEIKYFGSLDYGPDDDSEAIGNGGGPDGRTNIVEYSEGTDPSQAADSDGDGMNDWVESLHAGLDPNSDDAFDDPDGDRYPNIYEVKHGTDPFAKESTPTPDYVLDPKGDANDPGVFNTFADALNVIDNNGLSFEILEVAPGRYRFIDWDDGGIEIYNESLMIISRDGPERTILDYYNGWVPLDLEVGGSVVDGFTVNLPLRDEAYGAVYGWVSEYDEVDTLLIQNCRITGSSDWAMVELSFDRDDYDPGAAILRNVIFSDIDANGPIIANYDKNSVDLENCTFLRNESYVYNSTWYAEDAHYLVNWGQGSEVRIVNSILADELGSHEPAFYNDWGGRVFLDHTLVHGADVSANPDNLLVFYQDPLLTDLGFLQAASTAAIDLGKSLPGNGSDIHGEQRNQASPPDLGADEFVDADADGWADWWKDRYYPTVSDLNEGANDDADALGAAEEYFWGTDPFEADTDGDGLSDSSEVSPTFRSSPTMLDTDLDLLADSGDASPLTWNRFEAALSLESWFSADDLMEVDGEIVSEWMDRQDGRSPELRITQGSPFLKYFDQGRIAAVRFGLDAVSGEPSVSTLPMDSYLDNRIIGSGEVEVFVVLQAPVLPDPVEGFPPGYLGYGGLWSFSGSGPTRYPDGDGWIRDYLGAASESAFDPLIDLERFHLYNASVSEDDGTWNAWINGYPLFSRGMNDFSLPYSSIVVGRSHDSRYLFAGSIAELLVFSKKLSESERQEVQDYLLQRYRVPLFDQPQIQGFRIGDSPLDSGTILEESLHWSVDFERPDYVDRVDFYVSKDGLQVDETTDFLASDDDGADGFSTYLNLIDRADESLELKALAYGLADDVDQATVSNVAVVARPLGGGLFVEWQAASDVETLASQLYYHLQYTLNGQDWIDLLPLSEVNGTAMPVARAGDGLLTEENGIVSYVWDVSGFHDDYFDVYLRIRAYDGHVYSDFDVSGPYDLDNGPPILNSFAILEGDLPASETITVTVDAVGAESIRMGESADLSSITWQGYDAAALYSYTLSSGDGRKDLYVQAIDRSGNLSETLSMSIHLLSSIDHRIQADRSLAQADVDVNDVVVIDGASMINGVTVTVEGPLELAGLYLLNGAVLTSPATTESEEYRLDIRIAGPVYIDGSSAIDVTAKGYLPGRTDGNQVYTNDPDGKIGGSHGGIGAPLQDSVPVYGSLHWPTALGSGSGLSPNLLGVGGGAIRLRADSLVLAEGAAICADGAENQEYQGSGGAGGSVWIDVDTIAGGGVISAAGGGASDVWAEGFGGSGGRVALYFNRGDPTFDLTKQVAAFGGLNLISGGAGTFYYEEKGLDSPGNGHLIIDNDGRYGESTPLPSVGSGFVESVSGNVLTASPGIDFPTQAGGLAGLWVEPDANNHPGVYFRILENTANTLTVAEDDVLLESIADAFDNFQGVVHLKSVTVRGEASVTSSDPLAPTTILSEDTGGTWTTP